MYGGPQVHVQIQKLTSKSKSSRPNPKAHVQIQKLASKSKSSRPNPKARVQIQKLASKSKSSRPNPKARVQIQKLASKSKKAHEPVPDFTRSGNITHILFGSSRTSRGFLCLSNLVCIVVIAVDLWLCRGNFAHIVENVSIISVS